MLSGLDQFSSQIDFRTDKKCFVPTFLEDYSYGEKEKNFFFSEPRHKIFPGERSRQVHRGQRRALEGQPTAQGLAQASGTRNVLVI